MNDWRITAEQGGTLHAGERLTVRVDNLGPTRTFLVSVSIGGVDSDPVDTGVVPRMGSARVDAIVPSVGAASPKDTEVTVSADPDGASTTGSISFRARYLPEGWFDRTDRRLTVRLGEYARGFAVREKDEEPYRAVLDSYSHLQGMNDRPDRMDRFFKVGTPAEVAEYGDCTELEGTVRMASELMSKGLYCCLLRLSSDCYVGAAAGFDGGDVKACRDPAPGEFLFVRPSDALKGLPMTVSLDRSYCRASLMAKGPSADIWTGGMQ